MIIFTETNLLTKVGKISTIIANSLLFFILCSRWIVAGYFPLSNLYESLLFLTANIKREFATSDETQSIDYRRGGKDWQLFN